MKIKTKFLQNFASVFWMLNLGLSDSNTSFTIHDLAHDLLMLGRCVISSNTLNWFASSNLQTILKFMSLYLINLHLIFFFFWCKQEHFTNICPSKFLNIHQFNLSFISTGPKLLSPGYSIFRKKEQNKILNFFHHVHILHRRISILKFLQWKLWQRNSTTNLQYSNSRNLILKFSLKSLKISLQDLLPIGHWRHYAVVSC